MSLQIQIENIHCLWRLNNKMSDGNTILSKWNELKSLLEVLEHDVNKNVRGVAAAGIRVRKGLRSVQASTKELIKLTLEADKSKKEDKSKE